jgi:DNA-binding NarL/FixJ family response regulator
MTKRLDSQLGTSERATASASPPLLPLRALIVDDAISARRLLRAVLEHSPHFVVVGEAGNGSVAIALAESLQPDVVLLDITMPRLDGASALSRLVTVAPNALVIIVSGATLSACEALTEAGATAFIPKGIAPHELLMRLGTIVGRWVDSESPIGWQEAAPGIRHHGLKATLPFASGQRAVVYDDDPVVRQLITEAFRSCDVSVIAETDTAPTLFTVIDLAQPEFVVLDIAVNGEPDTAVLAEVKQRSLRSVVVVYSPFTTWRENILATGASAFIPKPRFDELAARLAQLALRRSA